MVQIHSPRPFFSTRYSRQRFVAQIKLRSGMPTLEYSQLLSQDEVLHKKTTAAAEQASDVPKMSLRIGNTAQI